MPPRPSRRAILSAATALGAAAAVRTAAAQGPALAHGDVVLQASRSARSGLIRKASASPYSHVGLVEVAPDGVFVIEAIGKVSRTPWAAWRRRGEGGKATALRASGLDAAALGRVVEAARAGLGRPYDARYRWDDESLYCSELVAKAFERGAGVAVGERQTIASLRLSASELGLARRLGVDPAQELVTPASVARDGRFRVVFSDFEPATAAPNGPAGDRRAAPGGPPGEGRAAPGGPPGEGRAAPGGPAGEGLTAASGPARPARRRGAWARVEGWLGRYLGR